MQEDDTPICIVRVGKFANFIAPDVLNINEKFI